MHRIETALYSAGFVQSPESVTRLPEAERAVTVLAEFVQQRFAPDDDEPADFDYARKRLQQLTCSMFRVSEHLVVWVNGNDDLELCWCNPSGSVIKRICEVRTRGQLRRLIADTNEFPLKKPEKTKS